MGRCRKGDGGCLLWRAPDRARPAEKMGWSGFTGRAYPKEPEGSAAGTKGGHRGHEAARDGVPRSAVSRLPTFYSSRRSGLERAHRFAVLVEAVFAAV